MAEEKKAKVKRPTAKKRILQSEAANLRNRSYKAKVATLTRSLKEAAAQGSDSVESKLSSLYSAVDKGVKTGMLKPNKAARIKSRLCKRSKVCKTEKNS